MKSLPKHFQNSLRPRRSNLSSVIGVLFLFVISFVSLHRSSTDIGGISHLLVADGDANANASDEEDNSDNDNSPTELGPVEQSSKRASTNHKGKERRQATEAVTRNNVAAPASSNDVVGDQFSNVECQIDEYHGLEEAANAKGNKRPVVLRGIWDPPNEDWRTEDGFLRRYGEVPYYIKDNFVQIKNDKCVAPFSDLWHFITSPGDQELKRSMLAFTNDKENAGMFGENGDKMNYDVPDPVKHIDSFTIVSTMTRGQSHEFHRHGESWIGQAAGHKVWWFLPSHHKAPKKVNACDYLTGKAKPPAGTSTCVQSPGDVIWFPHDWFHATCSISEWNVALGRQLGPRIRQNFPNLPTSVDQEDRNKMQDTLEECSGVSTMTQPTTTKRGNALAKGTVAKKTPKDGKEKDWTWFDGDVNSYYNALEVDHNRNPKDINKYAVHRWLGKKKSTQVHYELIHQGILKHGHPSSTSSSSPSNMHVLDAGCGLGSALMWMEKKQPSWKLEGRTLSEEQAKFINTKLPQHNFQVQLESYDSLEEGVVYDAIYSIEAAIHSTDMGKTLGAWSKHLDPDHGVLVLIDDYLRPGVDKSEEDVDLFARSWLANSLYSIAELSALARRFGLELVESRDLLAEYRVVELNYKNKIPSLNPATNRNHQGWMGSKYRQKLTVEGKLGYDLLVFRKMAQATKE